MYNVMFLSWINFNNNLFKYVLSTMGANKESISKFLIGNRFHVKLRILNPANCKQSLHVMVALMSKDWFHLIMSSRTMYHAAIFPKIRAGLLAEHYFGVKGLTLQDKNRIHQLVSHSQVSNRLPLYCKFESSRKDESRWQSTDSSKAYRNTSAFKCHHH